MTDAHEIGNDWTCSCGYDCFGGSGAYSWELFIDHLPLEALIAERDRAMDLEPAGSLAAEQQDKVIADLSRRINAWGRDS